MSKNWKKSIIFLTPPQDVLAFFEFGKKSKFDDPPLVPNLGKIWIWENFEFGEPPPQRKKNRSLKHLKLPKNHFKTNLFFIQLKHLKSTFTFGNPPSYQKVHILNCGLFDSHCWPFPHFGLFPLFVTFFNSEASLMLTNVNKWWQVLVPVINVSKW